ncbi:hypothetical protein TanjilG_19466 [Lupinus angustifolius]|uniref:Uncharacterized protein n=1 Tax=Lupinus angustifolius TaxID=3871 RepID=A0A4P1R4T5_LUPAN|nr:PREDICTED: uncharacterized protein LOC109360135 [Lupinus angustifolius]OIW01540.1 hypothetical protein TanjilG_19466 [Lupinus angustifolius]
MASNEFFSDQEATNHNETTLLQDPYYEEDQEDTLSLCDLPTYSSDSAQWDDYFSIERQSSTQTNDDDDDNDDFFEFSSEEFTTSIHETTAKNIIFCGKLIPFKEPPQQHRNDQTSDVHLPCHKPKHVMSRSSVIPCDAKGSKNNNLCDYASIKKVSLMRSTTKSRWNLFMFGFGVSTEMDLRDIRSRQSRQGPTTMIPASEQGREMVKNKGKKNMKGLWRIVKSFWLLD